MGVEERRESLRAGLHVGRQAFAAAFSPRLSAALAVGRPLEVKLGGVRPDAIAHAPAPLAARAHSDEVDAVPAKT